MGPRAIVGVLGTGVPLRPMAWLHSRPSTARLHQQTPKTLTMGQASRGGRRKTSSGAASPGRLARGGEIKARRTSQGSNDVSHDDQDQTGARRAPRAQRPCFLFGAKEASAGAEYRGIRQRFPYRCNETKTSRPAGQRSPWSPRRRHHQRLPQTKTTFVRITCTSCLPSNWPLWDPFPLIFGKRTKATINRTSHHHRMGGGKE